MMIYLVHIGSSVYFLKRELALALWADCYLRDLGYSAWLEVINVNDQEGAGAGRTPFLKIGDAPYQRISQDEGS